MIRFILISLMVIQTSYSQFTTVTKTGLDVADQVNFTAAPGIAITMSNQLQIFHNFLVVFPVNIITVN